MGNCEITMKHFNDVLDAMNEFNARWRIAENSTLENRKTVIKEEVDEVFTGITNYINSNDDKHLENVCEELGDVLAALLGTITWCNTRLDSSITLNSVLSELAIKLRKRTKFSYSLRNLLDGGYKVTHWQKTLKLLETERSYWEIVGGPNPCHPEIYELLTEDEKGRLEIKKAQ